MQIFFKIIYFYYREYKLNLSGFQDILTNITFFFVSIFVFIFSIGPDMKTISLGISIVDIIITKLDPISKKILSGRL